MPRSTGCLDRADVLIGRLDSSYGNTLISRVCVCYFRSPSRQEFPAKLQAERDYQHLKNKPQAEDDLIAGRALLELMVRMWRPEQTQQAGCQAAAAVMSKTTLPPVRHMCDGG